MMWLCTRDQREILLNSFTLISLALMHFICTFLAYSCARALHFCFVLFQQTNFSNVVLLFALHLNLIAYSKQYPYRVYLWQFSFAFAILCCFERAQVTLKNVSIELSWYHWMFQSFIHKILVKNSISLFGHCVGSTNQAENTFLATESPTSF